MPATAFSDIMLSNCRFLLHKTGKDFGARPLESAGNASHEQASMKGRCYHSLVETEIRNQQTQDSGEHNRCVSHNTCFAAKLRSDGSQAAAADQQKQDAANRYLFGSRIHVRACCGVDFMAEAEPPGIR